MNIGPCPTLGVGHALDMGHVGQALDIKVVSNGKGLIGKGFQF